MRIYAVFIALVFFFAGPPAAAEADWRWKTPKMTVKKTKPKCDGWKCHKRAKQLTKLRLKLKIARFNMKREREWVRTVNTYIPDCTWYGESGTGPEFARYRYTMPNSENSGAYGKFQFMPQTYAGVAKYHDWSPLDQEIAARRLHAQQGTGPWSNCH